MSVADANLEALLDYLKTARGFDFTAYKRSSLMRRIQKRQQAVGIDSHAQYQTYLETHLEEFGLLFNTILLNVTSFFRDQEAWAFLTAQILPRILSGRADSAIRVWTAGCASGEEADTLAMILAEQLGIDAFRRRVKIYASDVDADALWQARHATYTAVEVQDVPNTELRLRRDELNTANAFLASILTGLEVAVVVVDPKLQVLAWNHQRAARSRTCG